jgi:hypothetical protein
MTAPDARELIFSARTKLREYIDALWLGRANAADDLVGLYLQRLAVAARLSTLLDFWWTNIEVVKEIIQQENKAFPRDFLSTESGRAARSAFNLFSRSVNSLEEFKAAGHPSPAGPKSLVGKPLSTVTFVWDYVQLGFDDCGFNVFCPIKIKSASEIRCSGDAGFRDRLCEAIGQIVRKVNVSNTCVEIEFDRYSVELSSTPASGTVLLEPFTFFGSTLR